MRILKTAWRKWLVIAKVIGNFQARILLTVFYFLFVIWLALPAKAFTDPLHIKKSSKGTSWWHKRDLSATTLEHIQRQS